MTRRHAPRGARRRTPRPLLAGVAAALLATSAPAAATTTFTVNPEAGNNTFSAVFDAAIGERINAVGAAVACTLAVDEERLEGRAHCTVPLTSIRVDNDDVKSDHFRQWATNKKSDPASCTLEVDVPRVALPPPVAAKTPAPFTTEGTFTVCGRGRDDEGPERITGTVVYLPAGAYGKKRTLRIRARVERFDRERYGVSPKNTPGWLARVQQLAPVVATEGTIDVSIFATTPDNAGDPSAE